MDFLRPEDFGLTSPPRAEVHGRRSTWGDPKTALPLVPNTLTSSPVAPADTHFTHIGRLTVVNSRACMLFKVNPLTK